MAAKQSAGPGRRSSRAVRLWDRGAEIVITIGGMAVLAAVLGICVLLVWVSAPLLVGGRAESLVQARADATGDVGLIAFESGFVGELRAAAKLGRDGIVRSIRVATGEVFDERPLLPDGAIPRSLAWTPDLSMVATGLDDGTVRINRIGFGSRLLDPAQVRSLRGAITELSAAAERSPDLVARFSGDQPMAETLGSLGAEPGREVSTLLRRSEDHAATLARLDEAGREAHQALASMLGSLRADADAGRLVASLADPARAEALEALLDELDALSFDPALEQLGEERSVQAGEDFGRLVLVLEAIANAAPLIGADPPGADPALLRAMVATAGALDSTADLLVRVTGSRDELSGLASDPSLRANALELLARLVDLNDGDDFTLLAAPGPGDRPLLRFGGGEVGAIVSGVERSGVLEFRLTIPLITAGRPIRVAEGPDPVVRVAVARTPTNDRILAAHTESGVTFWRSERGLEAGDTRVAVRAQVSTRRVLIETDRYQTPDRLLITEDGEQVWGVWAASGELRRYAVRPDHEDPDATSTMRFVGSYTTASPITASDMTVGARSLLIATDDGRLRTLFTATQRGAGEDGRVVVGNELLGPSDDPVVSLGVSARDRTVAALRSSGRLDLMHATSAKRVASVAAGEGDTPIAVFMLPRRDGMMLVDAAGGYRLWALDAGHPRASFRSLFRPVLYEGEYRPQHVYQSSAGSEGAEVKYGLVPLIFGTLKATVVAMIIAAPLAVLAAIYSSEFLSPGTRKAVKPTIELMASLPSVVLGFIAAMVLAPYMRDHLPAVLVGFVVVPLTIVLAASLWRALPDHASRRIGATSRLGIVFGLVAIGCVLASGIGPLMERTLFSVSEGDQLVAAGLHRPADPDAVPAWVPGDPSQLTSAEQRTLRGFHGIYTVGGELVLPGGDLGDIPPGTLPPVGGIRRWLDGAFGGPTPGWLVALFPIGLLLSAALRGPLLDRRLAEMGTGATPGKIVAIELLRFGVTIGGAIALTLLGAQVLVWLGHDPRDSIFGPFSVRNTLVVGIIMGFAIIPIIYTISEDAMRSVPDSLRLASLGAGATPWQTAVRVVLPVAASGIFSAMMIGLGRAVGETMIVLMATGNTPEISMNIFSGFRTLAANIAVELPEAPPGGTHYRVLFLCGLVLFLMTFVINTTAELVRQHFRKRNAAL